MESAQDGTFSKAKATYMAAADGLPKKRPGLKRGEKAKNRQDANGKLNADIALEALDNLGIVDIPYEPSIGHRGYFAGYARAVDADDDLAVDW